MKKVLPAALLTIAVCFPLSAQYAISNVSVIPMTADTVMVNQTVVVEEGVIKTIGSTKDVRIKRSLKVIDGSGKFLMPGLMDMHTHFFSDVGDQRHMWDKELKLMVSNGITTARLMTGHPSYLELRKKIHAGEIPGPELFIASPQLAGKWLWSKDFKNFELVETPGQATSAVKKFKSEGYDEIKITFMVTPDVYESIIRTAQEIGIRVTGHVGPLVGLPPALEARQQIEHMDQFLEALLPDTSYNHGQSVSDFNIYSKEAWATVPYLDAGKIRPLAAKVKEAGISVTPTNYFMISSFGELPTDEQIMNTPDYNFISPALLEEKWKYRKNYMNKMAPEESRAMYTTLRQQLVYELWKAGVPLMAGSDSPEYFIVQGFALHDELRTMVEAGLTPFAALQTATVNPASYLEILNRTATLEEGKEADMILLSRNPLEDIVNTRSIYHIFNGEAWYDETRVDELLNEAKALGR